MFQIHTTNKMKIKTLNLNKNGWNIFRIIKRQSKKHSKKAIIAGWVCSPDPWSDLVDDLLHLDDAEGGQLVLDEVDDGLETIALQDELLMHAQDHQSHLEDHLKALQEDQVCRATEWGEG